MVKKKKFKMTRKMAKKKISKSLVQKIQEVEASLVAVDRDKAKISKWIVIVTNKKKKVKMKKKKQKKLKL